ncbi:Ribosomal RNA large subunit methyltransferase I [bacterium HR11]|nr:Ribosomal RNA large subunit methyltransferase I [bacterium HR11]
MHPVVQVPRSLARRVRRGQLWVRRGEWEAAGLPVLPAGSWVRLVERESHEFIALAYYNPHSQIVARVVSYGPISVDAEFWYERFRQAWDLRAHWLAEWPDTNAWRWVHAEADGLPGLIVDYYDGHAVLQILTLGMDTQRDAIVEALRRFPLKGIAEKSVGRARQAEGLDDRVGVLWGDVPAVLTIREGGVEYLVDWVEGHKTGFYLDQRENRLWVGRHARDRTALDLCAYTGSFSLAAVLGGAQKAVAVETSRKALELGERQAERLGVQDRIEWVQADVFDYVRHLVRQRARFDIVILDPPPLAPSRRDLPNAIRAYRELNRQAMRLVRPGGWLLTCTCSHHVRPETFVRVVYQAAASIPRRFRILAWRHQPPDHPFLLSVPETAYFQALLLQAE